VGACIFYFSNLAVGTSDSRVKSTDFAANEYRMIVAYRYRTFWPRLLAGFIDGLVFLPITLLDRYLSSPARGSGVLIGWAIFSYSAYWLYSVLLHARFGQTVGKMLTSVKVMNVSETAIPSLKQAFLRDVGYIAIDILTLAYFIYLVLAQKYSIGQQQLEDGLSGTILSIAGAGMVSP
jgi:uncharacterized RDD family membrane protein YckC